MKKLDIKKICFYLIPALILAFIGIYIYKYNVVFIDSDAASELLHSKILSYTHTLFTDKWLYSTTLPVIDYQIIYSLLFTLTSNWLVVRTIGTVIVLLLYILSAYFMLKQMNVKHIVVCLVLLLMPFSIVYFGMYIAMPYYVFTNIKIMLSLGLVFKLLNTDSKNRKTSIIVGITALALIQGLEGIRGIMLFIVPFALTVLTIYIIDIYRDKQLENKDNNRRLAIVVIFVVLACLLGYAVNTLVFSKQFAISSYSDINFVSLSGDTIAEEINSWLNAFGHTSGSAFSSAAIHNILCYLTIILSIIAIIYNLKKHKEIKKQSFIYAIYYCFAVLIMVYFGLFIDINKMGLYDVTRYNIPIAVMAIPLIIDWFGEVYKRNVINKLLFIIFVSLMIVCGVDNYRLCTNPNNKETLAKINTGRVNNNTVELNDIVYMLKEKGYKNGYSYFWCGNVITELSNGDIEMWVWAPGGGYTKQLDDLNQRHRWLQLKSHLNTNPEGKLFLIFNQEELDYSGISDKLNWNNVIYNSENYTVYGYENHDELIKDFNN